MRFQQIIEQVYFHPWFITAAGHASIQRLLRSGLHARAASDSDESDQDILRRFDSGEIRISDMVNARPALSFDADRIAHVHILGPVGKHLSKLERACGATGFEQIRQDLDNAVAGGARGVLLHISSPGGMMTGTHETAQAVAALATSIPVVVYGDLICSAAYYIAAGATAIVSPFSGCVGNIGVLIPWIEFAEQMKMEGLVPRPITNKEADLKGTGHRGVLNEAEQAFLQSEVDRMGDDFWKHITATRALPEELRRGQWAYGDEMMRLNLVDQIGEEPEALALLRSKLG
jgi:ClpP class serine protease